MAWGLDFRVDVLPDFRGVYDCSSDVGPCDGFDAGLCRRLEVDSGSELRDAWPDRSHMSLNPKP